MCQASDDEWKKMTIANTSEAQFEQEYGNSFLGTGNTLINADTLLGMRAIDIIGKKTIYEYMKDQKQVITMLQQSMYRKVVDRLFYF